MTPTGQAERLIDGCRIVVPVSFGSLPDSDAFYDEINAAVLGHGAYLQIDAYERVGWFDTDTILYEVVCFAEESDIYDRNDAGVLPPRRDTE